MNITTLPETDNQFYPTPRPLVEQMIHRVKWGNVKTVLEPSAGKGDILDGVFEYQERAQVAYNEMMHTKSKDSLREKIDKWMDEYPSKPHIEKQNIDCVEIDPNLRAILKDKEYRVIHDDFLTLNTFKRYDLILMNPPFANGAEHLIKALSLMKNGGQIVCLLNATTIKNSCTNARKALNARLDELGAEIQFIENSFSGASSDRQTDVETAMVYVNIPAVQERNSTLFDHLKADGKIIEKEDDAEQDVGTEMMRYGWLENMLDDFQNQQRIGIALIDELEALKKKGFCDLLSIAVYNGDKYEHNTVNGFVKSLRRKFWQNLLTQPAITELLTSDMKEKYSNKVDSLVDYDFTEYNVKTVINDIGMQLSSGVEDSLMKLFETLTDKYSYYDECQKNIHYYNGWKTNKSFKIGKKVILPVNGFSSWRYNGSELDTHYIWETLSDLERAMNYLDKGETKNYFSKADFEEKAKAGVTKNLEMTYWYATFYKKGTCHIVFKDDAQKLIDRLNIYAGKQKNWLPPVYGKAHYKDMSEEEKAVIDSFQGVGAYEEVLQDSTMLIGTGDFLKALPMAV